uniref:hypothetical protein n=1 Tax=Sphingomonas bacterium TaxID=1895847 RepID=UPI001C2D4D4A
MATAPVQIDEERWAEVQRRGLDSGGHKTFAAGVCAMEAAAYISRQPWSDAPECVCPVIGAFMRSWNDALPDDQRTSLLLPLIPLTIGTKGSDKLAERRSMMAVDWYIRVHTPAWLRLSGLTEQADGLAALPELTAQDQMPSIRAPLEAVQRDASAARSAAGLAAGL